MRRLTLLPLVMLTLACASGSGRTAAACDAPHENRWDKGRVYARCEVDRAATLLNPNERFDYPRPAAPGCVRAELEFVVDPLGNPDAGSIRIVSTNSRPFADALARALPGWRHRPALKDGVAVPQLERLGRAVEVMVVVAPAGTSPSSVRPPAGRSTCR